MRKIAAVFAIITTVSTLVSAEVNFDIPNNKTIQQELASLKLDIPTASAPAMVNAKGVKSEGKEWTIMVYINAKNNLEPYAFLNLNQMEMVGSSDKVNIVVEIGRLATYDTGDGGWKGTRRYLIQKDADDKTFTSPMLMDIGNTDMGNYQNVINFGNWAKPTYPAKHYMLIIWNHGSGWDKGVRANVSRGISYDDETGNHINTPQMGEILKGAGGVDVYGSDACLMQMAEVDYQLKDSVQYIVGSEETEPGDGYTYNTFLAPLIANPSMGGADLAKAAVDAYVDHYTPTNTGATQSYVNAAVLPDFLTMVNNFTAAVMASSADKALVKKAVTSAQSFEVADNKDLYHFTDIIVKATKNKAVSTAGKALETFIATKLVGENKVSGSKYANAHGISSYLPSSGFNSSYSQLDWANASKWAAFIGWYQK